MLFPLNALHDQFLNFSAFSFPGDQSLNGRLKTIFKQAENKNYPVDATSAMSLNLSRVAHALHPIDSIFY